MIHAMNRRIRASRTLPEPVYLSFVARNGRLDHQLFRMNIVQSRAIIRGTRKCRIRLTPKISHENRKRHRPTRGENHSGGLGPCVRTLSPCSGGNVDDANPPAGEQHAIRAVVPTPAFDLCRQQSARLLCLCSDSCCWRFVATAQSTSQLEWQRHRSVGSQRRWRKDHVDRYGVPACSERPPATRRACINSCDVPPEYIRVEAIRERLCTYLAPKVNLVSRRPPRMNIKFRVAGMATMVTVEGQAPLINRTDASLGNTIEETQIAQFPIADPQRRPVAEPAARCRIPRQSTQWIPDTEAAQSMACAATNPTSPSTGLASTTRTVATPLRSVLNMPPGLG